MVDVFIGMATSDGSAEDGSIDQAPNHQEDRCYENSRSLDDKLRKILADNTPGVAYPPGIKRLCMAEHMSACYNLEHTRKVNIG